MQIIGEEPKDTRNGLWWSRAVTLLVVRLLSWVFVSCACMRPIRLLTSQKGKECYRQQGQSAFVHLFAHMHNLAEHMGAV